MSLERYQRVNRIGNENRLNQLNIAREVNWFVEGLRAEYDELLADFSGAGISPPPRLLALDFAQQLRDALTMPRDTTIRTNELHRLERIFIEPLRDLVQRHKLPRHAITAFVPRVTDFILDQESRVLLAGSEHPFATYGQIHAAFENRIFSDAAEPVSPPPSHPYWNPSGRAIGLKTWIRDSLMGGVPSISSTKTATLAGNIAEQRNLRASLRRILSMESGPAREGVIQDFVDTYNTHVLNLEQRLRDYIATHPSAVDELHRREQEQAGLPSEAANQNNAPSAAAPLREALDTMHAATHPAQPQVQPESNVYDIRTGRPMAERPMTMEEYDAYQQRVSLIRLEERSRILQQQQQMWMAMFSGNPAMMAFMQSMPQFQVPSLPNGEQSVLNGANDNNNNAVQESAPQPEATVLPQQQAIERMQAAHALNVQHILDDKIARQGGFTRAEDLETAERERGRLGMATRTAARYLGSWGLGAGAAYGAAYGAASAAALSSVSWLLPSVAFYAGYKTMRRITRAGKRRDEMARALHKMDEVAQRNIRAGGDYSSTEAREVLEAQKGKNTRREIAAGLLLTLPLTIASGGAAAGIANAPAASLTSWSGVADVAREGAGSMFTPNGPAAVQAKALGAQLTAAVQKIYAGLPFVGK